VTAASHSLQQQVIQTSAQHPYHRLEISKEGSSIHQGLMDLSRKINQRLNWTVEGGPQLQGGDPISLEQKE
jgi:hypothetical protein